MTAFNWDTGNLSPNQYKIADYIQKNTQLVLLSTEQEIADALGLSIASVSRFWRSVGYTNLKDFKAKAREQLEITPAAKMKSIMHKVQGDRRQHELLDMAVSNLEETMAHFDAGQFDQAVHALTGAERVFIYGQGPSQGLVELLYYRMTRLGLEMKRMRNGSELFEDLIHVTERDLVVLFCFIRMLPESKVILEQAKQAGYRTLLITDRLVSDFTDLADYTLFASRGEMWEFHSMVAPTFLIENLIIAVGMHNQEASLRKLEELSRLRKQYAADLPR
ncbi:MurR/RpiR family transcriptional regulator [Paenibacillus sambharensis]|uniref:MurR/RpiR family transcriptional regulator n=1 Tax=Paenibacillus sambharensis TaxID=1803190 RepID=A0A2W1LEP7_9BACL|nr:MurR/RpiR family transcriptional regulator [Paenibacillus sambharensis]PZD97566.1 MurR/RpiR family transcriptional regulator [Paenibacillus sambharensis]